jgi:hypothetical protein
MRHPQCASACPRCAPTSSRSGRPHSMLDLRDWLDGGGMGGMLADRTLPGSEDQPAQQRGNNIELPFLGQPARLQRRPLPAGALLRRKVFFMAGLVRRRRPLRCPVRAAGRLLRAGLRSGGARAAHSRRGRKPTWCASRRCAARTPTTGSTFMISGSKMRLEHWLAGRLRWRWRCVRRRPGPSTCRS